MQAFHAVPARLSRVSYEELRIRFLVGNSPADRSFRLIRSEMPSPRFKLLVAEDDAVARAIITTILASDSRFDVHATSDGGAAWAAMENDLAFDAYVFDLIMPGCGGMELVARARNDRRMAHIPVVLCSAMNDRETILRAASLGVRHYVLKPVSRIDVLQTITAALGAKTSSSQKTLPTPTNRKIDLSDPLNLDPLQRYAESVWLWLCQCRSTTLQEQLPALLENVSALRSTGLRLGAATLSADLTACESSLAKLHRTKSPTMAHLTRSDSRTESKYLTAFILILPAKLALNFPRDPYGLCQGRCSTR